MKHMGFNDSAVLQEFGRIMGEKDQLKKVAQIAADPAKDEFNRLFLELQQGLVTDPKRWERAKAYAKHIDPKLYSMIDQAQKAHDAGQDYRKFLIDPSKQRSPFEGISPVPKSIALSPQEQMAAKMQKRQALSVREKTAEPKSYDVTPKEDIVHEAHPKSAVVSGDVVENLNEQQDADLAVAQKSATIKNVLTALYKLAKRLQAEKNEVAYKLVKETFLDISKSLKK